MIELVPSKEVPNYWPEVRDLLSGALDKEMPGWSLPDILAALTRNEMSLWVYNSGETLTAAAVTYVMPYPRKRTFVVFMLGGRGLWKWGRRGLLIWGDYSKGLGCTTMQVISRRRGWRRFLGDGWREACTVFERSL